MTFTKTFRDRLSAIETEAFAMGLNWTTICKDAGISRATPDRWKRSTPATIKLIDKMEQVVAKHKAEKKPS